MSVRSKAALLAIALLAAAGIALALLLRHDLGELFAWVHREGAAGAAAYAGIYVVGTVLFFPGSVLTFGAGFAYGLLAGTALASVASLVGASLAFGLGRTLLRGPVERQVARRPRLAAVDRAIGSHGFHIIVLLRLSPIVPFNLLNYALGVTRVELRDYVVATFVGMLPGTLLWVYLGSAAGGTAERLGGIRPHVGLVGIVLFWVGLAATAAVTWILVRISRRALRDVLDGENHGSDGPEHT